MSLSTAEAPLPKHDPFAALRERNFVLFASSRLLYAIGATMLQSVILWHVYELSGSPLSLGLVGIARLVPALSLSLFAGAVADSYSRRNIIMVTQMVPFLCAIVLAVSTLGGWVSLELIYGIVVIMGTGAAFEGPARAAILPAIVKPEVFPNAVTFTQTLQQLAFVSGPAVGGGLIALSGVGACYVVFTFLSFGAIVFMSLIKYRTMAAQKRAMSLEAIKEGVRYVRGRQELLGAMTLDMFAVIFGGVKALMPVYAVDVLHVGATGYGVLAASFEVGAFAASFLLLMRPPIQRPGLAMLWTVLAFGVGTIAFGLSRNIYLSAFIYMLIGASDQISVVMRSTTIQLSTPDELRGRVSAVNQVFIQSSNQLNAVESGLVASITSAVFAVVSGGFGTLAVVAAVWWKMPGLARYRTTSSPVQAVAAAQPAVESLGEVAPAAEPAPAVVAAAAGGSPPGGPPTHAG